MKKFFYLYLLHFLNDGLEGSYLLLLPFIAKDLHINLAQVGLLGTTESGVEVILSLPAGYLALKYGGFRTIIFALFLYSFAFLITGFTPTVLLLFLSFLLAGIGFGIFNSIGLALAAKWSNKSTKGKQMGNYSSMGDLGKTGLTSLLPLIATSIGWRISAGIYGLIGLAVFIFLHGKIKKIHEENLQQNKSHAISLWKTIKSSKYIFALIANAFDTLGGYSLFVFLPFLLLRKGFKPTSLAIFAFVYFVGTYLGKTGLGRFIDVFESSTTLIVSEFLMAICIFFISTVNNFIFLIVISFFLGIFSKGTVPVINTMVSEAAAYKNFEKAFAFKNVVASLASCLAPLMLGIVAYKFGITMAFKVSALVTLCVIFPALAFKFAKN